jgi:hypothetical protein
MQALSHTCKQQEDWIYHMQGWDWLSKPQRPQTWGFIGRVLLKAGALFIVLNVVFALVQPMEALGNISLYNTLVDGRERLPFGESNQAYNLSLNNVNAMFASHDLATPKADDEYRVLVLGDSSVWGILLRPEETLSAYLTQAGADIEGKRVVAYNIGHPIMSLTKDLLLLEEALEHDPDMILWLTTLQSFPRSKQTFPPIVQNNTARITSLMQRYDLDLPEGDLLTTDFMGETIIGQRRALADWWRLQMFGFAWQATGIDQVYPEFELRSNDFEADTSWEGGDIDAETTLDESILAFDVLRAGHALVRDTVGDDVPIVLINEPIFIADGENSDLRYNLWYPRWAYDQYRALYAEIAERESWQYVDLWDSIATDQFTDSPVHLTPNGSQTLASIIGEALFSPTMR